MDVNVNVDWGWDIMIGMGLYCIWMLRWVDMDVDENIPLKRRGKKPWIRMLIWMLIGVENMVCGRGETTICL